MAPAHAQEQTPYDITPRVWRDEQPGDDPRLVVSVTFVPRRAAERWQDVRLRAVEVRANNQRWTPRDSAVSPVGEGGFEVRASGDATLPAGAAATIGVTLQTATGDKGVSLPVDIQRVS